MSLGDGVCVARVGVERCAWACSNPADKSLVQSAWVIFPAYAQIFGFHTPCCYPGMFAFPEPASQECKVSLRVMLIAEGGLRGG